MIIICVEDKLIELGFPIGSKVVMTGKDPWNDVEPGETGVVCHYEDFELDCNIGVEWEKKKESRHSCMGYCKDRFGRYVPHTSISLANVDYGEFACSDFSISTLFDTTS